MGTFLPVRFSGSGSQKRIGADRWESPVQIGGGIFVKITWGLMSFVVLLIPVSVPAEVMNNGTILTLTRAGLSEGLIIDKVNSESCGYDVSTSSIIELKKSGISDNVISSMVRRCATLAQVRGLAGDDTSPDPKIRHSPGIYLMESWLSPNILQVLHP
jgi:hypothetical protein